MNNLNARAVNSLLRTAAGDQDFLRNFFETYRKKAQSFINNIDQCFKNKDIEGAIYNIHSLKSSSKMAGAKKMVEICEEVESSFGTDQFSIDSYLVNLKATQDLTLTDLFKVFNLTKT